RRGGGAASHLGIFPFSGPAADARSAGGVGVSARAGRPGSVEAPLAVYAALEMIEEFGWPSTSPEEAVLDPARRGDLLEVETVLELLRRLPQPQPVPVLDRCDRHVQLIDQVGVEELAHRRDPAADPHVLAVGELERALEGGGGGGVEEVEGGLADGERLPLVMGEHDDGRVEGRLLAPPADPAVVGPGAALGAELVPAHDLRPDTAREVPGQMILEPARTAGFGASGEARGLERLADPGHGVAVPEGPSEGLLLAGADAVEGDAEVLHTHARSHGGVLSEGISMVRPAAAGVTSAAQRDPRSGAYTTGAGRG